ncbi:16S rRNA (guanine(966)-N(2))-methyltransferase RsmD [Inquilinus limosus]|uniref:16S rRNA (guanine(966)-N(2))-methyltransferase RsmD n=1 Tax=Inquilinus limosus TaxID=171674 RepID=UPI0009DC21BE|nr:16S rRNA (guanine(966)-N(2))-methyltransferase RsmD [Inquilinus limosus]
MPLRLVAGRHKGRVLAAPPDRATRPTSDRVREAVFNILAHAGYGPDEGDAVAEAVVLDAFAGSGALAFEALSRGAAEAWLFDSSAAALGFARRNAEALNEAARAHVLRADALKPPPARAHATLLFLDPPYRQGLVGPAIKALSAAGWLAPGCLVVAETAADEPAVPGLDLLDERRYGIARISFGRVAG